MDDLENNDIKSMYYNELEEYIHNIGLPAFRTKQLFSWMHEKFVDNVENMTNLPKDMREKIKENGFTVLKEETRQVSKKDGTIKFLFKLSDGQMIETVFMKYSYGNSICISSQAGCRMGCRFCASTIGGLVRNLKASEMLEQVYAAMRITGERISNIVIMGTGEPLDNYDNVIRFIRLITDEKGYNLSMRNITMSTCGLVPEILRLADEKLAITLAISLHAPNDEKRRKLMPIAEKYSISEILDACKRYFEITGRRISFEYSLVKGQNDSGEDAMELSRLLKGLNSHVNLIPVNSIEERDYEKGDNNSIQNFKLVLEKNSINVTIRRSVGSDIDAACGQLRRKYSIEV